MQKYSKIVFIIIITILTFLASFSFISADNQQQIIYYYGQGCSHCAKVDEYLTRNDLYQKYAIVKKEVYFDKNNVNEMNAVFDRLNISINRRGVPVIIINNQTVLMGDRDIIANFIKVIEGITPTPSKKDTSQKQQSLTIPLVIGAALVDAINPCEFAVLIILLSAMTIVKKDKTALKGGLLFSLAIFLSYFLMGLGIYKVLSTARFSLHVFKGIGIVSLLLGLWNMKDFFAYQKWLPPIEVPFSWRPNMKSLIRRVTSPIGAFVAGLVISAFLLPCTSGPYLIILSMLSQKEAFNHAVWYLLLYNLIFVSPMIAITLLVYRGLDPEAAESLRQKNLRRLHLIAGILLILMGIYIIIN